MDLSPCTVNLVEYDCTKQFTMVSNACLFGDDLALSAILPTDDPREQKRLDRHVRHFDREFWQQECEHLVFQGNLAKSSQNEKIFLALVHNAQTAALSAFTDSVPDDHAPEVLLAHHIRPITALLKKGAAFDFTSAMEDTVRALLAEIAAPLIPVFPDWDAVIDTSRPFRLHCDASTAGLGATLEQEQPYGSIRPIVYISRATLDNEQNWTPMELGAGCVV